MIASLEELRRVLVGVPEARVVPSAAVEPAIADSVRYLASDAALRSIDADTYWPKWDSPWWHMVLLHELGEARRIPERVVTKMVEGLEALPIHSFPIHPEDTPAGADPYRDSSCHCALGSIYQVLSACGRDVDRELPWIKPWFARYQMTDGGLNCDHTAYLQTAECPSSMVGTVAPFEAMSAGDIGGWTPEQAAFVERASRFFVERRVMLGSPTRHNAEERACEVAWRQLCFPRYYFYDVVRGLSALVRWAETTASSLPLAAVAGVVDHLVATAPDGVVRLQRRSYEGVPTMAKLADGTWRRGEPASSFPLLEATSNVGQPCPYVTRQWTSTRQGLLRLLAGDRITAEA